MYLVSTGVGYGAFSYFSGPSVFDGKFVSPVAEEVEQTTKLKKSGFWIDPSIPKDQECPLNGGLFTQQEKEKWETRRPLGIMIENHEEARPQSGLNNADIVYEAVAEGGITRFLAIFYCAAANFEVTVGPVRSARTYFLDFVSEYGDYPLYAHVGGANTPGPANALGQIEDYGWLSYNDLNQFSLGFPTYWRDYERVGHEVTTEHTVYSTTTKLWQSAAKRGLSNVNKKGVSWDKNFVDWKFADEANGGDRGTVTKIEFGFWKGYDKYTVVWDFEPKNNFYLRTNGGRKHLDFNTDEQVKTKNVVVQFVSESNADDGYENNAHLLYGTKGQGKGLLFQNGKAIEILWSKSKRTERTIFTEKSSGKEVKFVRGAIWIEALPIGTKVEY